MCGFVGAFGNASLLTNGAKHALAQMKNRGPDGESIWQDEGVLLAHNRLAILDLDNRSTQPMRSYCGRYIIIFNGEIYNYLALRADLKMDGFSFNTESDTEVILNLFVRDGPRMLSRLHGMFSFIIWDNVLKNAFVARDPYGIKPLYFGHATEGIIFASQVKALAATKLISDAVDINAQIDFLLLGSISEPNTWYKAIRAFPPGHFAWVNGTKMSKPVCWFNIGNKWSNVRPNNLSDCVVQEQVKIALSESVRRHLVSDVPVAVLLSGGIDSGTLAGFMSEVSANEIYGVTLAYDEFSGSAQDEVPIASSIAKYYGISHHVRRVSREEFLNDLPLILSSMDQPSIDGVNTWYACKAVSELGIKVVISGIGGDELFQGYDSFRKLPDILAYRNCLPSFNPLLNILKYFANIQAKRKNNSRWKYVIDWSNTIEGLWFLNRGLYAPDDLKTFITEIPYNLNDFNPRELILRMTGSLSEDPILALGQIESMCYLRNQLLRDSDWASMAHGVELRAPLVDSYLLSQLSPIFSNFKRFPNKRLLANSLRKPLLENVILRRKTGFGIPISRWLSCGDSIKNIGIKPWANHVFSSY